jgi:hypothetical protein
MIMTVPSTLPLPVSERIRSAWLTPEPVALRLSDSGPFTWLPAMPPPTTWPTWIWFTATLASSLVVGVLASTVVPLRLKPPP